MVLVNRTLDPPLIALQLLDTDERKLIGKSLGEFEKSEGTISAAVKKHAGSSSTKRASSKPPGW